MRNPIHSGDTSREGPDALGVSNDIFRQAMSNFGNEVFFSIPSCGSTCS